MGSSGAVKPEEDMAGTGARLAPITAAPEAVTGDTCSTGCRNGLAASSLSAPLETIQVGNEKLHP